ncbi:MAG TPA: hypothetical protein VK923_19510 [Euzebyales bacterium]|nr:hypothetical protein [Euzebyales bacterium]
MPMSCSGRTTSSAPTLASTLAVSPRVRLADQVARAGALGGDRRRDVRLEVLPDPDDHGVERRQVHLRQRLLAGRVDDRGAGDLVDDGIERPFVVVDDNDLVGEVGQGLGGGGAEAAGADDEELEDRHPITTSSAG